MIHMSLRLFQGFETLALQRHLLRVARFDVALTIGIAGETRQRDHTVTLKNVAIKRIERGIVNVRL